MKKLLLSLLVVLVVIGLTISLFNICFAKMAVNRTNRICFGNWSWDMKFKFSDTPNVRKGSSETRIVSIEWKQEKREPEIEEFDIVATITKPNGSIEVTTIHIPNGNTTWYNTNRRCGDNHIRLTSDEDGVGKMTIKFSDCGLLYDTGMEDVEFTIKDGYLRWNI